MAELNHETPPEKAVADPETYREALDGWMQQQMPNTEALHVHDVDMPTATGFSNETVFFSTSWNESGQKQTRKYVARIEPKDGGLFPIQTPACEVSCELQHRIMDAVRKTNTVPMPELFPYEGDPSVLGSPFFVMEFIEGKIPADVPRYTQEGFLVFETQWKTWRPWPI
jgi:aminoglycoside phosphotransferase (APT) family kinase protein